MFELEEMEQVGARIKVMGVGGCGCNAVNNMITSSLKGVEFLAANTDIQTLKVSLASSRVQLGSELTKGLGAGGNPEIGLKAAEESEKDIRSALEGADMVFVTAGLGGGTGTGASPVIARIARELGALTVAVVTKPFPFEGKRKMKQAEEGEQMLSENVDALIIIPNNRLLSIGGKSLPMLEAFKKADDILLNAVKGISDLVNNTGLINVDFNDVRSVMCEKGKALMGIGTGTGDNKAKDAAHSAISSPLLEDMDITGAKGLLINITCDPSISMDEMQEASSIIQSAADENANIIWGVVIDESMSDQMNVTVVATGFSSKPVVLSRKDDTYRLDSALNDAKVANYDRPAFMRKKENKDKKEVIKMGMVVDESVIDDEEFEIPTFLRKKAD
ncbi:MAG: cell division protein FtsZ [Deltaproteobacteria bacterium]|nr:MAG: cell division protein FtsZ [Deltaproteobacteria bacterium]